MLAVRPCRKDTRATDILTRYRVHDAKRACSETYRREIEPATIRNSPSNVAVDPGGGAVQFEGQEFELAVGWDGRRERAVLHRDALHDRLRVLDGRDVEVAARGWQGLRVSRVLPELDRAEEFDRCLPWAFGRRLALEVAPDGFLAHDVERTRLGLALSLLVDRGHGFFRGDSRRPPRSRWPRLHFVRRLCARRLVRHEIRRARR